MAEDKKVMDAGQAEEQQAERAHVVKLDRPVKFEQKEYTEIDLGGLDGMTIQDAINAQRSLLDQSEAACSLLCETTTAFAMEIAARASGLPIEFFKTMPRDAGKRVQAEEPWYMPRALGWSRRKNSWGYPLRQRRRLF